MKCNDLWTCQQIVWSQHPHYENKQIGHCACHPKGSIAERPKPPAKTTKKIVKESEDNGNSDG